MSYTLAYQGAEIDDILGRAAPGGALDTAIAAKQDALTFDAVPTQGSTNPAESGGIYDAIQAGGATALAAFATDSVSGDVVSFPDGADSIPAKAFTGSILPAQSGSGDPAPDNVRPISGWTGANIYRTGVNVWDEQWELGSLNWATGAPTASNDYIRSKNFIPVTPGAAYYLIAPTTGMVLYGYDSNQANGQRLNNYSVANLPAVLTIPDGVHYLKWRSSAAATTYPNDVAINYPSTDHDYHAYNGSTILLDFGQTVYAGTLTALGGGLWKIQPTHAIVDMGDLAWTYDSVNTRFYTDGVASAIVKPSTWGADALCSMFGGMTGNPSNGHFSIYASGRIYFKDTQYTTAAAFKTAVTGQKFLYPLATLPDPITITGEDLQTLLGANTVWTDVGSVTGMTYRADTALYIQKLIGGGGTLQTLSMASPSPSLSLGRVDVLAEPEVSEPEQTEEEAEQLEQTEEPGQTEEA